MVDKMEHRNTIEGGPAARTLDGATMGPLFERCQQSANKSGDQVRCTVRIGPEKGR